MINNFRVMVVDDELAMRESLAAWLDKQGYSVACAAGGPEALQLLQAKSYDLLLIDIKMREMDGMELLKRVRRQHPRIYVLMITAYGSIETAVQAMKQGANDYILKPFDPEQLMDVVEKIVKQKFCLHDSKIFKETLDQQERTDFGDFVAAAPCMLRVIEMIHEVAPTDSAVLITGETGTGKEMVARLLHVASKRAHGHFMPINCGAQSENLLESELFGHEKGAFTGAIKARHRSTP